MSIIIQQMRKASANPELPMFRNERIVPELHAGEMFLAGPGYEIAAVYVVDDRTRVEEVVSEAAPCGRCAQPRSEHVATDHQWEAW